MYHDIKNCVLHQILLNFTNAGRVLYGPSEHPNTLETDSVSAGEAVSSESRWETLPSFWGNGSHHVSSEEHHNSRRGKEFLRCSDGFSFST